MKEYEYKFIRFGGLVVWSWKTTEPEYKSLIEEHGKEGWRLVQIFAPTGGVFQGRPAYYEIIFEREIESPRS